MDAGTQRRILLLSFLITTSRDLLAASLYAATGFGIFTSKEIQQKYKYGIMEQEFNFNSTTIVIL